MGQSNSKSALPQAIATYRTGICQAHNNTSQVWIPDPRVDDVRRLIGESFAGTDTALGEPFGTWSRSHIGTWYTYQQHAKFIAFGLGIPIRVAFDNKSLILAKGVVTDTTTTTDSSTDKSSSMVATAVVMELDPNPTWRSTVTESWLFFKAFVMNLLVDGLPKWRTIYQHYAEFAMFGKKIVAAMDSMEAHHPSHIHWYVLVIGTHPNYQGQGHGADIMQRISDLADHAGRTLFLEAGESNRRFYEKMGYQIKATEIVPDPNEGEPLTAYAMVRYPRPKSKDD